MININNVKTYSLKSRFSKVKAGDFAKPPLRKKSFLGFYDSLPNILRAKDIRAIVNAIVAAKKRKKSVIFMAGAHVIKCGLNPVLIELIKKKIISCLCLNGAGIIHDFEIAFQAKTSEDVAENLASGKFGMAREPAEFINAAVKRGQQVGLGLGDSVAKAIAGAKLPHKNLSLICSAYKYQVPVCVFTAVGTDIIHQHPSFDAAASAKGSLKDFHTLTHSIRRINQGGVVINFGSAVILPEV